MRRTLEEITSVVGDSLFVSAFLSHADPFTRAYCERIVNKAWRPFLAQSSIKVTKDPLDVL